MRIVAVVIGALFWSNGAFAELKTSGDYYKACKKEPLICEVYVAGTEDAVRRLVPKIIAAGLEAAGTHKGDMFWEAMAISGQINRSMGYCQRKLVFDGTLAFS